MLAGAALIAFNVHQTTAERADTKTAEHQAAVSPSRDTVIRIPRLGASWAYVVGNDVHKGPQALAGSPGHGNYVVAGHTYGGGNPFHALNTVRPGDLITITSHGHVYTYKVTSGPTVIPDTDVAILHQTRTPMLTVLSCTNPYHKTERLVVTAVLLKG